MQSLDTKWLSKKPSSLSQFPTASPIMLSTHCSHLSPLAQILLSPFILSLLLEFPLPCTSRVWHKFSQERLWYSSLSHIGTGSICSAWGIASPIQALLDLCESRPKGNGWSKSPYWRWHLVWWRRRVIVKLSSPVTWTFSQCLGLLIPKARPATGRKGARESYAVKLLLVLFLTVKLLVSPFLGNILLLLSSSQPPISDMVI